MGAKRTIWNDGRKWIRVDRTPRGCKFVIRTQDSSAWAGELLLTADEWEQLKKALSRRNAFEICDPPNRAGWIQSGEPDPTK